MEINNKCSIKIGKKKKWIFLVFSNCFGQNFGIPQEFLFFWSCDIEKNAKSFLLIKTFTTGPFSQFNCMFIFCQVHHVTPDELGNVNLDKFQENYSADHKARAILPERLEDPPVKLRFLLGKFSWQKRIFILDLGIISLIKEV